FVPKGEGADAKRLFKGTYKLANSVVAQGKSRYARQSPYIVDPSLHAINQKKFSKKFSYPSKHSVIGAAMTTLLHRLDPHRGPEYRWMEAEIDFSRLYAGGHYPSDLTASAYLGTLVAGYVLAHRQANART